MGEFNLQDYVPVNERLIQFWRQYPEGRVQTELLKWEEGIVLMRAAVYSDRENPFPIATGHAYEKENSNYINRTSAVENAETSAVGRALALAGYEIKRSIASQEEMAKMQRAAFAQSKTELQEPKPPQADPVAAFNGLEVPERADPVNAFAGTASETAFTGPEVEAIVGNKCMVCQKPLNASQLKISMNRFGKPLCPEHQKGA
jgi:hypothetical protein